MAYSSSELKKTLCLFEDELLHFEAFQDDLSSIQDGLQANPQGFEATLCAVRKSRSVACDFHQSLKAVTDALKQDLGSYPDSSE